MKRFGAMLALSLVAALPSACSEDVVVVTMKFDARNRGFTCVDGDGRPLLARAAETGAACAVLDFIRYDESPSCRPADLRDVCCDGGCSLLAARKQIPIDVAAIESACRVGDTNEFDPDCIAQMFVDTVSQLGWSDAPSGFVSLRVTLTNEVCEPRTEESPFPDQIGVFTPFDEASLMGCAFSCPAQLAEQESDLRLDLDVVTRDCEPYVRACADVSGGLCEL